MADKDPKNPMPLQGEGDYIAARRFDEAEAKFVKKGPVEEKAREAEKALDGDEGATLEDARRASAQGHAVKPAT